MQSMGANKCNEGSPNSISPGAYSSPGYTIYSAYFVYILGMMDGLASWLALSE